MSVADSRVLLSEEATAELQEFIEGLESREPALFEKTVQAIRDALEASLKTIFLIAAVTTLLSFLLIVTIPEISMDAEVRDKKAPDAAQPGGHNSNAKNGS